MCYSTTSTKLKLNIETELKPQITAQFEASSNYTPYYRLNGFTHGQLQVITMADKSTIKGAEWGLVPDWAAANPESFRKKSNTLNARSETIFTKPSYKRSATDKRCLIIADGFFEPHHINGKANPYFCYQPSEIYPKGDLFLFAGLYNETNTLTTTILTTEANAFFAEIHNKKKRMPLVLDPSYYQEWLNSELKEKDIKELMAVGFSQKEFKAHPVSKNFYKKGIDTNKPYIIKAIDKQTLF
jgi:putative SOS response-associated peptidase YedK